MMLFAVYVKAVNAPLNGCSFSGVVVGFNIKPDQAVYINHPSANHA